MGYERGNVTKYLGQSRRVTKMYGSHKNSFFSKKMFQAKKYLKNFLKTAWSNLDLLRPKNYRLKKCTFSITNTDNKQMIPFLDQTPMESWVKILKMVLYQHRKSFVQLKILFLRLLRFEYKLNREHRHIKNPSVVSTNRICSILQRKSSNL